jgi:hypothetical protein
MATTTKGGGIMIHLDISVPMLLFWSAVFFLAAMGAVLLCLSLLVPAYLKRLDYRYMCGELKLAEYEAAVASPHVQPEPVRTEVVHVGEVIAAPQPDLLPVSGPVHYGSAPIFDKIPLTLPPPRDDLAACAWDSWVVPTGAFPVIEEAPAKARERFATATADPAKPKQRRRKVTADVGGDVHSEMAEVTS